YEPLHGRGAGTLQPCRHHGPGPAHRLRYPVAPAAALARIDPFPRARHVGPTAPPHPGDCPMPADGERRPAVSPRVPRCPGCSRLAGRRPQRTADGVDQPGNRRAESRTGLSPFDRPGIAGLKRPDVIVDFLFGVFPLLTVALLEFAHERVLLAADQLP